MLPVLGREIVEREQRLAILDQALDRLVVFDAPGLDEGIERLAFSAGGDGGQPKLPTQRSRFNELHDLSRHLPVSAVRPIGAQLWRHARTREPRHDPYAEQPRRLTSAAGSGLLPGSA
jgi:hypothetical protein